MSRRATRDPRLTILRTMRTLRVATYNIHKGLSIFNRHVVIHAVRDQLRALNADVVFLQEVAGRHDAHARRHGNWPREIGRASCRERVYGPV